MLHNKVKAMAIMPERVPSLRPSTLTFMQKAVSHSDLGISTRKYFMDAGSSSNKVRYGVATVEYPIIRELVLTLHVATIN